MGKTKYASHSAEFRAEAIRLARESAEPLAQIARELGVKQSTLRMWVKASRVEADPPLAEKEREELQRLRQQVRTLRMERDILKKATAFFAKHSV
jgi:transposase